jgi:nucleotide-binding universal stress UspA family protein
MSPVTKILVPTDSSPHSARAIELATAMACRYGATLELLHVFNPIGYALAESQAVPGYEQRASGLDALRRQLPHTARALQARRGSRPRSSRAEWSTRSC